MKHAPFDRHAVRLHRDRAAPHIAQIVSPLQDIAGRLLDRLDDTLHRFRHAWDIGGRGIVAPLLCERGMQVVSTDLSPRMARRAGTLAVTADEEFVPFAPGSFDLVVANLSLHWVNDLPGALLQIRHTLRPDGLFLASLPALGTLAAFRTALTETEFTLCGGAAPRVSPFATLQDLAGLLQRAGFALPVADLEELDFLYADGFSLLRDLRHAGETNALTLRSRTPPPRTLFPAALATLPTEASRTKVGLKLAMLTGWAPPRLLPALGK